MEAGLKTPCEKSSDNDSSIKNSLERHRRFLGISETTVTEEFEPPLDDGISGYVLILRAFGVETFESCEGGDGHAFLEPTIRFHGDHSEGFRALAIVIQHGLPVDDLRRVWNVIDGEPTGPSWELTFWVRPDKTKSSSDG